MSLENDEKQMIGMLGLTLLAQKREEEAARKTKVDEAVRQTAQYQAILEEAERRSKRMVWGFFLLLAILIAAFATFVSVN